MGDLHDALNNLAGRGTARGFDDVFAAAERDVARGAAPTVGGSGGSGDDLDPIPFVEAEPVARPRRPLHTLIAVAGLAALVLVGGLAVNAVVGGGGGAGSPQAAVRQLADAISHEDPLAAADVIAPEEVQSLHDTLSHAEAKAAELKLVETAGAPLSGIDFNVAGLDLSSQSLGDGVAKVTIDAGTISASTHKAQFSPLMQKVLQDSTDNSATGDLAVLGRNANLPTFVVAVRRNGNWYVSASYTLLEYVREANQLPAADFGSGQRAVATLGADSPDAAVQDAMRALQQRDWSKLIALAAPDEIPVYDYRAALLALAQRNQPADGNHGWFTLDSMTTSSQVDGDHANVTLHAAGATDSSTWSLDGGCFGLKAKPGSDAETLSYCDDIGGMYGVGGFPLVAFPFVVLQRDAHISVVQEDGRWFVNPVGSLLDAVNAWIDQLDHTKLDELLGIPELIPSTGTLELGTPVTFAGAGIRSLALEAHAGEVLTGMLDGREFASTSPATVSPAVNGSPTTTPPLGPPSAPPTGPTGFVMLHMFDPSGNEVIAGRGLLDGEAITIPADGRYTFVFAAYGTGGSATIWDYADAPPLVQQMSPGGQAPCTYTRNGEECSSSSAGPGADFGGAIVTPTSFVEPPNLPSGSSSSGSSAVVGTTNIGPAATAVAPSAQSGGTDINSATSVAPVPHG